jgi:hypothetical protein
MSPDVAEDMGKLNALVARLKRDIHLRDLRTGRWYTKVLSAYVAYYASQERRRDLRNVPVSERAAIAHKLTERVALFTAMAGVGAAAGVTAASIATVDSGGLAAPVVLPLAGAGMVGELLLRSLLHLQLACELAELYGMPFRPGGETELTRIYALAFRAEQHETEDDPGRGLVERVVRSQEAGGLGKLVAAGLIGETLLRNAIPFADVLVSSFRNWQLTKQVGRFVQGYASRRVALDEAVKRVSERSPQSLAVLIEGLWFIFISDGRLTQIETALLAHLLRQTSAAPELTTQFISDEAGWLDRLKNVDPSPEVREMILRALEVAAVVDSPVSPSELTVLKRAAETLGCGLEPTLSKVTHNITPVAQSSVDPSADDALAQHALEQVVALARASLTFVTRAVTLLKDRPHPIAAE